MIIDTHCHLDFKDFDADRDEVIDRAIRTGVARIVNVASSMEGSRRAVGLAKKYDMVYASVGIHPQDASSATDENIAELKSLAGEGKVVAVGEVGLDYYRNLSPKECQEKAFLKFIRLAVELKLPLIIHSREADPDMVAILKRESPSGVKGVMHCFSGDKKFLEECLALGLYISFTCNITFKNAKALREVAKSVPIERVLLETDAPFLAPQEFRGQRNEPAYLKYLLREWAELKGLSERDIARITTHNANNLFRLGLEEPTRIAYPIRNSLYLNITNNCTNLCDFCVRNSTAFVKGHNLKLEHEPSVEEILDAAGDPSDYDEIVFCGYGEPTSRMDVLKRVAGELKKKAAAIRLVTNGHGDLINKRPIVKELKGLVDKVSVSLNADTENKYNKICKPIFGAGTYNKVLSFIKDCVGSGIKVEVTCLDLPDVDIKTCEKMAKALGAGFRLRHYGVVG